MKKLSFLFILTLLPLLASAQTVSDVKDSGCLRQTRGGDAELVPTIVLTKEGSTLSVQVLNYQSNCGTVDFHVTSTVSGGSDGVPYSVNIGVIPYLPDDLAMDCICPYNVSFAVRDVEANSFYLSCWWYEGPISLEEGKPLVLEDIWEEAAIDDVKYTLRKAFGCAKIEDGSAKKGEYRIPSEINIEGKTYSVTSIDYYAFKDNKNLTKVTIPQTVKNMDLSNNVGIDSNPFSGCTALRSIEVEEGNPAVCAIDGVLFNKEKTKLLCYPPDAQPTSYTVPESVTSVAGLAFSYGQHLQKVSLSDKVTSLGASVFYENKSVEEVRMPSRLSYLGNWMFTNCSRLKSVTIPQGVTSIGRNAFQGCTSLTSVSMPESVKEVDYSVFEGCTSLESVTLSPKLEHIMHNMFADCRKLKELIIPDSVTWIMPNAFKNCTTLKTLDLPKSVYRLGSMVFAGCKLDTLYIRGIIESRWMTADIFSYMGTQTKLYVQPSEVEKYKAIYKGPVYPLPEAQDDSDYLPFVELGKQWHLIVVENPIYSLSTGRYWMCAEMEYDGKTYIYTYLPYDVEAVVEQVGLLREENRRVYMYDEETDREIMLYDFSLKEGDTFTYEYGFDQPVNCKVLKQGWLEDGPKIVSSSTLTSDTMDIKYRPLRTWTIGRDNGAGEYDEVTTWVEGIGTLENMFSPLASSKKKYCLTYVERQTESWVNEYLPFSFCNLFDMFGQIHGCDLPTGEENNEEDDLHHKLTYELEGDRLHVYGDVFTQCGPNNYALFRERKTDDPLVNKIEFTIQKVEPTTDCRSLHATSFYVPGFDPNMTYIVVDNQGEEHPVINKTQQMVYRAMVEEGKVWKVGTISGNPVQMVDYYYFDGDTIIGGKSCKQMMCQRFVSPEYSNEYGMPTNSLTKVGVWYEENKKVYFYDERKQAMALKYDFSLEANDTLQFLTDWSSPFIIGPKQAGGLEGFKGVYRDIMMCGDEGQRFPSTIWLEGVGDIDGPTRNPCNPVLGDPEPEFLMSCAVGDEVIFLNDAYEDGATPAEARKSRFDFTHTIKTKPKAPRRLPADTDVHVYGEYNDQQLGINLDPLADTYQVSITGESGQVVYKKAVNAGTVVALNIDISAYAKGRYTVTIENSSESFTGEFGVQASGISDAARLNDKGKMINDKLIYNLQGQQLSTLQKGLNIVNGQKVYAK